MGTHLHQALRTLCFNTQWKYAVFWKLKHRSRMILTWEDAYYDNHDDNDPPWTKMGENLSDWHSRDPLWLAVAKMSYHVYSLGEGIIGQAAVTGNHMWIFADKLLTDSCLSFEHYDGWQCQFSSGIKTVVVVAIVPHGVIQLGSLNKIPEDLILVKHIKEAFFALQASSVDCTPSKVHSTMRSSSCLSNISTRSSSYENFHDGKSNLGGKPVSNGITLNRFPTFSSIEKPTGCSYIVPPPGDLPKKTVEVVSKDGELELSTSEGAISLQSKSETFLLEQHKQVQTRLHIDRTCDGETSFVGYHGVGTKYYDTPSSYNSSKEINLCNVTLPADDSRVDVTPSQSDLLDFAACSNQNAILFITEPFDMQIHKVSEKNVDFRTEVNNLEPLNAPFKFSAGCELHEVLGPAFQKQSSYCDWVAEKTLTETLVEMPEGVDSSSLLTADSGSEHLLEAVVANVCRSGTEVKNENSFCKSVKSLLTTEKMPQPTSENMTLEKDVLHCLSSETCGVSSSKGVSSRSRTTISEQLDSEPAKTNRKRARPGENCRPRPRDRQLIQDRIKELRELVPSGSKCSIDSLLERTIKHMFFMQSITKQAEKLNKCTESRFRDKEAVARGLPSYDQGSSWAMEVGSPLKVCPIMVENINMNGQMLIEMMCEECSHFLEIAEAIKSLGLTILKGVTEACGKKIWMCFVVEGQNNRSMHRMDVLWSLVQILQSKTSV